MLIKDLPEGSYVYRYKQILLNGDKGSSAPQRVDGVLDRYDKVFSSKEEFNIWYKELLSDIAELDQCLNYCKHFVREKGNLGTYSRDDKYYFGVNGTWCGSHDYGRGESKKFFDWVIGNFGKDWFELMDKYKTK
jgi:hypothetical protein